MVYELYLKKKIQHGYITVNEDGGDVDISLWGKGELAT